MRTAMGRVGVVLMVAAATLGVNQPAANAEPAGHSVVYTLTVSAPGQVGLFYLAAQPPDMAAYNADAYSFVKSEQVNLEPGVPWTFPTTLADPQWAILTATSPHKGLVDAPNPVCEISVDGQVVVHQEDPYIVRCALSKW